MPLEKLRTGISGLDEMLNGGIPRRRHVALYGGPGTGKTTFGFEFLYRGAKEGEAGLYLSLEEGPEDIVENMKQQFSSFTDIDDLVSKELLFIETPANYTIDNIVEVLEKRVIENEVKRVVIDSSTMIKAMFESESEYRKTLVEFFNLLKSLDCNVFLLVEAETSERTKVKFEMEHYVMDGLINLYSLEKGDNRVRALEIFKMRGTDHSRDLVPFKVTPNGIKVYVGEKVF